MNFTWGRGMSNCSIFGFEMVNDLVGIFLLTIGMSRNDSERL